MRGGHQVRHGFVYVRFMTDADGVRSPQGVGQAFKTLASAKSSPLHGSRSAIDPDTWRPLPVDAGWSWALHDDSGRFARIDRMPVQP